MISSGLGGGLGKLLLICCQIGTSRIASGTVPWSSRGAGGGDLGAKKEGFSIPQWCTMVHLPWYRVIHILLEYMVKLYGTDMGAQGPGNRQLHMSVAFSPSADGVLYDGDIVMCLHCCTFSQGQGGHWPWVVGSIVLYRTALN